MTALFLLFFYFLQSEPTELTLILLDADGQRVGGQELLLKSETNELMSRCTTSQQGECTMRLESQQTLIRGWIELKGSRQPITWPGGSLTLTLHLTPSGHFDIPQDVYVTRTPVISFEESETALPLPTQTASLSLTPSELATETAGTMGESDFPWRLLFQVCLFLLLLSALALYLMREELQS